METIYLKIVTERDIPRLDTEIARRVFNSIENKLQVNPLLYGLPLRGKLHKCWKLRVGDYRVIYTLRGNKIIVVGIGHRKEVYEMIEDRI